MTFLHPLLLGAMAAVAIPVLIHLLLKQRPRPRPWAAMRWLEAAAKRAQRKWQLTNLLLLFLRILAVAAVVLACARPIWPGTGAGGRLVLVIDRTASMGPRGRDPGPLAAFVAAFASTECSFARIAVIAVDGRTELLGAGGVDAARDILGRVTASALPGGLDDGATGEDLAVIRRAGSGARPTFLLISDFQQDRGERLAQALAEDGPVVRWAPVPPLPAGANAALLDVGLGDLLPGRSGTVEAQVLGAIQGLRIGVDGAPPVAVPVDLTGAGERRLTLPVPPLTAGVHRLQLELTDQGIAIDNALQIPLRVRDPLPALVVSATGEADYLQAALGSEPRAATVRLVSAPLLSGESLLAGGLVAVRTRIAGADAKRVADWVRSGGVLWAAHGRLQEDTDLAPLIAGVALDPATPIAGGPWQSGEADLDRLLSIAYRERMPTVRLPTAAEPCLRAGVVPAVVAIPAGSGWVVVELIDLANDPAWQARGATPLWALRIARRYTAKALHLPRYESGATVTDVVSLSGNGLTVTAASGERLLAAPGTWQRSDASPVLVLPNRQEAALDRPLPADAGGALAERITRAPDQDLGPWPLLAVLAFILLEGWLAARAGRTYG